jgi:hypothetical protein
LQAGKKCAKLPPGGLSPLACLSGAGGKKERTHRAPFILQPAEILRLKRKTTYPPENQSIPVLVMPEPAP